jgi:hypothetical protein
MAGRGTLVMGAAVVSACGWLAPGALAACQTGSVTFISTGAEGCYTVPAGVSQVQVVAVGGKGRAGGGLDFPVYDPATAGSSVWPDQRRG